jgi:muramoyltetrapeptide carboxypeptidase
VLKPPRLGPGARVGLISPAGPVTEDRIDAALRICAHLGFEAVLGRNARCRAGYLAGSDAERAEDLNNVIADPAVDAIWALRGGYGTMRILRNLDLEPLRERPKAFIGFSDNTAIHLAFGRAGLVSFHGPHAGGPFPPLAEDCFQRVLGRPQPAGALPMDASAPSTSVCGGIVEAPIVGGNLSLLAALSGTGYALDARAAIVVLEDVGEPAYRIDRNLMQLLMSGALEGAAGFALGRFTERSQGEPAGAVESTLTELLGSLGVPVVLGLPIGHVDANWCVPLGVTGRLDADRGTLEILESAVQ